MNTIFLFNFLMNTNFSIEKFYKLHLYKYILEIIFIKTMYFRLIWSEYYILKILILD